jgi:hypothetical protein
MREAVHLLRPADRDRDPAGPVPRPGIVRHINYGETAEVLLGLDERPVGEQGRAAARIDTAHDGRCVQAAVTEDEDTRGRHLLDHGPARRAPLAQLLQLPADGDTIAALARLPSPRHRLPGDQHRVRAHLGAEPARLLLVSPLVGGAVGLSFQHFSAVLRGQITDKEVRRKLRPGAAEEPWQAAT